MARPDKERKGQAKKHGPADSRFAAMHSDPRFARMPRAQRRVEIDSRFKGVFDDDDFQMKSAIDKRGRKVERAKVVDDMRRFYRLEGEEEAMGTAAGKLLAKRTADRKLQRSHKGRGDEEEEELQEEKADAVPLGDSDDSEQDDGDEVEDEEDGQDVASHEEEEEDEEGAQDGDEEEEEEEEATVRALRIRGMMPSGDSGRGDDSGEEDSDDEEDEEELVEGEWEEEERDLAEWGVGAMAGNPEEDIPMVEESHRLAAVDLEWSAMRAVDILAILNSFLPAGGLIQKVTVYPSDYGLAQMAEEREKGPQGIFVKSQRTTDGDRDDDGEEEDGGELDRERLRLYERSKLRWHYAVIVCDSTATASHLYKECDGMELEESSCRMDLRFVSDEQSFGGRKIRDEAREVPHDYAPPSFANTALQHTDPDLTWDKDDTARRKLLRRRMTEESLMEDDLKVYLASGTSESDDDGQDCEDELKRRRQLLLGQGNRVPADGRARSWATAPAEHGDEDDEHEDDEDGGDDDASGKGDMEVTFNSGLESLSKRLLSGRKRKASEREGEALFKSYAARKEERKQKQRALGRVNVESGSDDSDDGEAAVQADAGFGDPFFDEDGGDFDRAEAAELAGGSGRKPRLERRGGSGRARDAPDEEPARPEAKSRAESQRRRAELELLMMDDDALNAARAGFQLPSTVGGSGEAADAEAAGSGGGKSGRMSLKERRRLKAEQKRRRRHRQDDDNEEAGAPADRGASVAGALADPRFSALLESADYALDPTAPDFMRTPSNAQLAAEVASRRGRQRGSKPQATGGGAEAAAASGARQRPTAAQPDAQLPAGGKAAELKLMVANLKRRAPLPDATVGDGDQAAHLAADKRRGKAKGAKGQKQRKKDRGPGTLRGATRGDQRK